ncbi:MAG: hypothetical protein U5L72_07460 [Bacteroidales bacterium]|nr:hypothetical protein [Bacteroidales bacterium]
MKEITFSPLAEFRCRISAEGKLALQKHLSGRCIADKGNYHSFASSMGLKNCITKLHVSVFPFGHEIHAEFADERVFPMTRKLFVSF